MKKAIKILLLLCFSISFAQNANTKINKIQVIGSHNSYKKAIDPKVYEILEKQDQNNDLKNLQYEHIPILSQLDLGLRNLEIDVYGDEKGGRFANPAMRKIANLTDPYNENLEMNQPGFKMIHIPDIDYKSWYYTFAECLTDLKKWSEAHPNHGIIFITLEPKEGNKNRFGTEPEKFTKKAFDRLDAEILKNLGRKHVLAPDDVRGKFATLNEAVKHNNWPTEKHAAGKFMFILDNKGTARDAYLEGHNFKRQTNIYKFSTGKS